MGIATYQSRYKVYLIQRLLENLEMGGGGSKKKPRGYGAMALMRDNYDFDFSDFDYSDYDYSDIKRWALRWAKKRDYSFDYSDYDYSDNDFSDDVSDDFSCDFSDVFSDSDYFDYDFSDFDFSDDESDSEEQEAQELVDFLSSIESKIEEDGAICAKIKGMASKAKAQAEAKLEEVKQQAQQKMEEAKQKAE